MFKKFWKGLTGIEIIIVIGFGALFVLFTLPKWTDFKRRAAQSQAKFELQTIYAAEKQYFFEYLTYAPYEVLHEQSNRITPHTLYYEFSDEKIPDQNGFSIMAQGKKGTLVEGEVWMIDEDHRLVLKSSHHDDE